MTTGVWVEQRGHFRLMHAGTFMTVRCVCGESIDFVPELNPHVHWAEDWKQRHAVCGKETS